MKKLTFKYDNSEIIVITTDPDYVFDQTHLIKIEDVKPQKVDKKNELSKSHISLSDYMQKNKPNIDEKQVKK